MLPDAGGICYFGNQLNLPAEGCIMVGEYKKAARFSGCA